MMFGRTIFGSAVGMYRQASRLRGFGSNRPLHAGRFPQYAFSGLISDPNIGKWVESSILGNKGLRLVQVQIMESAPCPHALSFRSFIHSGEAGRKIGSMDFVQHLVEGRGSTVNDPHLRDYLQTGSNADRRLNERGLPDYLQVESNADIVHIKLMRNNAFVTVTDSEGNKKIGTSAGKLAGRGGKLTRYYGDAAAEDIGRKVQQMRTRSVVVKVNGFTFFKRKKEAILSFKDGFSNSQPGVNPIVYIEDTTRKPHNGCVPQRGAAYDCPCLVCSMCCLFAIENN